MASNLPPFFRGGGPGKLLVVVGGGCLVQGSCVQAWGPQNLSFRDFRV